MEVIVGQAGSQYAEGDAVSEKPVNEEWSSRFFRYAEEVQTEHLRQLWSKVLAGEVKRPGSFSLRTLDILRSLTMEEAELFEKWARYCIWLWPLSLTHAGFVVKSHDLDNSVFRFNDFMVLESLGLLNSTSQGRLINKRLNKDVELIYSLGSKIIRVERPASAPEVSFSVYFFTYAGVQLARLVKAEVDEQYLSKFISAIGSSKEVKIFVGDFSHETETHIHYKNILDQTPFR